MMEGTPARHSDPKRMIQVAFLLMSHIIEIGDTKQVFTVPANQKTDDYISGRFG